MPAGQVREIYATRSKANAISYGLYGTGALIATAGLWYFSGPVWLFYVAIFASVYLLIGSLVHVSAYVYHRMGRAVAHHVDAISDNDHVEEVDIGEGHGVVRLVCSATLWQRRRGCFDQLRESILSDKQGFARRFAEFKDEHATKYPQYARHIRSLKIEYLTVYPAKEKEDCSAWVHFAGEVDEIWSARYSNASFSELVWN